jgi:DNA-binding transcriptional MerR regulator
MPTATSNRPSVGHRRHPYGWSASQAAQLTGIPARTVQQWAVDGLVGPTYTNPALRIGQPVYTLGDVVRLKLTRDLLDAGVDRPVVTLVNQELATHPQPDHFWDHRRIAHKRWWLYLPYINDITHAVEIWRCKNRIKLQDLPPWL